MDILFYCLVISKAGLLRIKSETYRIKCYAYYFKLKIKYDLLYKTVLADLFKYSFTVSCFCFYLFLVLFVVYTVLPTYTCVGI